MSAEKIIRKANNRKEREVWEACELLQSQKRSLTYLAIGDQLAALGYRRGSNSDIRRYLKTWQKNQFTSDPESTEHGKNSVKLENIELIKTFKFYDHHLQQMERLLGVIGLLKQENQILRNKLQENPSASRVKPKITCR